MKDALHYLEQIVDPTIAEFEAEPTSVRRAFLTCAAIFHTVHYLPGYSSAQRQRFRELSSEFAVVDRVAHAFKHVETGHPKNPHYQPLTSDEVIARPPAFWDKGFTLGLSRWDDAVGGVTLDGERDLDLLAAMKGAVRFLRSLAEGAGAPAEPRS